MSDYKIKELTEEQQRALDEHYKVWFAIGTTVEPSDRPASEEAILKIYENMGLKRPKFIWGDSPMACVYIINILNSVSDDYAQTKAAEIEGKPTAELKKLVAGTDLEFHGGRGQFDTYWVSFYLFCAYLGVEYDPADQELLELWSNVVKTTFWWWPFEECCVICERPTYIHIDYDKLQVLTHNEEGPIYEFKDGWGLYMLNNTRVPKELVMTPADQLDPRMLLTEENAQVRAEIVRKVTMERIVDALNVKVIDKATVDGIDYELITLDLGDGRERPYVDMFCQSTGTRHVEGVAPDISSVRDAITWRNGDDLPTAILT